MALLRKGHINTLTRNIIRPLGPTPRSTPHLSTSRYNSSTSYTSPTLSGLNAVITGASRGIGLAIATSLASLKASCTLIGRNESTLSTACTNLTTRLTSPSSTPSVDYVVVDDIASSAAWELILKAQPRPHILINAAGVSQNQSLLRTRPEDWDAVVDTNLKGTMLGCRYAARQMLRMKSGGVIVNISSLLAFRGGRGAAAYAASKAGVLGLTRALAEELGPAGIRVNAIVPGYIETDMTAAMNATVKKSIQDKIPLKRFGTVDEVAEAAVFLATNKYANNCVINLDGGLSAQLSDPPKVGGS